MFWLLLACVEIQDSGGPAVDSEEESTYVPPSCDEVGVGFDGNSPATVGETWTVWPTCDGAAVFGAAVIRVTPVEMAYQDGNTFLWEQAGEAEIMAQTGSKRAYLTVTVVE